MSVITAPRNTFRLWVTRQSVVRLALLWTILYFGIAFGFALVYKGMPDDTIQTSGGTPTKKLDDIAHFSFATQATVGYGDYSPVGAARFLAAFQAFVGTALHAVALGIVTYKFIKRQSPIEFSLWLVYVPQDHAFCFRFVNTDADDNRDVKVTVTAFGPRFDGAYDTVANKVRLDYDEAKWIPSIHLFALRTKENEGSHHHNLGESRGLLNLSPINISNQTTVRLDVSGFFHTTGDAFFDNKDYCLKTIKCGRFDPLDNHTIADLCPRQRAEKIHYIFNRVLSTPDDECVNCPFHDGCPLDVATRLRAEADVNAAT